jgi:hypothetical protein
LGALIFIPGQFHIDIGRATFEAAFKRDEVPEFAVPKECLRLDQIFASADGEGCGVAHCPGHLLMAATDVISQLHSR